MFRGISYGQKEGTPYLIWVHLIIAGVVVFQMDFTQLEKQLTVRGIDPAEYGDTYAELQKRKVDRVAAYSYEEWGDPRRIREFSLVLRQILLHRAIKLFEASFHGLINDNGYSMCLCIRGHYETTAALGYLHNRLFSFKEGNLSAETVDRDIGVQILGTRDEDMLSKLKPHISEAKQVLTLLEYADKSVSKHILHGGTNEHTMLMDNYKFLCEFSHPNFHSGQQAYILNKKDRCFIFRHDAVMHERDAKLIGYLLISNPLFVALFDRIVDLLPDT